MEVDDPIAAKFQTLVESLMVKTTSDIVKVFTEVFLETRVEISRSWKEVDDLKQQLQESEEQRTHAILRSQLTSSFKKEDGGMSCVTPQVSVSDTSTLIARHQTSMIKVVSKSPLQTVSVVSSTQTSSCTAMTILGKKSEIKKAVVLKKKCIQKKTASTCNITSTHKLRDRQLSTQRRCLCCSADTCTLKMKHPKTNSQVVQHTYTCKRCGKRFYESMQLKHHKCMHECSRCGQTFTSLKNMATHRRSINPSTRPYPYYCCLCGQMLATQCGWNIHKRIHAHSDHFQNSQVDALLVVVRFYILYNPVPLLRMLLMRMSLRVKHFLKLDFLSKLLVKCFFFFLFVFFVCFLQAHLSH
uniref:C2H2-type domain-containing protein n=1 Tax=Electrophorus electricus TaxID=8005 RepID=A0A4W4GE63_ELEEL